MQVWVLATFSLWTTSIRLAAGPAAYSGVSLIAPMAAFWKPSCIWAWSYWALFKVREVIYYFWILNLFFSSSLWLSCKSKVDSCDGWCGCFPPVQLDWFDKPVVERFLQKWTYELLASETNGDMRASITRINSSTVLQTFAASYPTHFWFPAQLVGGCSRAKLGPIY